MAITLKNLIVSTSITPTLVRAVVRQMGGFEAFKESAIDVSNHGIDGGFSGFIYYTDTIAFTKRQKKNILQLAEDQANDYGSAGVLEMINSFGCLRDYDMTIDELAKCIYLGKGEMVTQVYNALAWYAGEEVCRAYTDLIEG